MSVIACENIKDILMDKKPSIRLDQSREMLFSVIPEFKESYGFDQKTDWHIYDVYNHTLKVVDNVPAILPLRIAALYHDMGKPFTFVLDENGIGHFPNHWLVSLEIFDKHYKDFNLSKEDIELISKLILFHDLRFNDINMASEMNKQFGDDIDLLFNIKEADIIGQNPKYSDTLYEQLENMKVLCLSRKK